MKRIRIEILLKLFIVLDPLQIHVQRFAPEFDMGIWKWWRWRLAFITKSKKKKEEKNGFCFLFLEIGKQMVTASACIHACKLLIPKSCRVNPICIYWLILGTHRCFTTFNYSIYEYHLKFSLFLDFSFAPPMENLQVFVSLQSSTHL